MFDVLSDNAMIRTMDRSMTLATRRLGLIASNLANIDTPGYRTRDFSFHAALKQALAQEPGQQLPIACTHPGHLSGTFEASLPPAEEGVRPAYARNDGNDVSIDRESLLLARTQAQYQLATSFAQTELRKIYTIVRTGAS